MQPNGYLHIQFFYSSLKQSGFSFTGKSKFDEPDRTKVGHDVWIGARAMILDGVTIGDGAIVAAGSVVVKDVPPYPIVGGVPAKEIRKRFDSSVVQALEKLGWWKFDIEVLSQVYDQFTVRENWTITDIEAIKKELIKKK